MGEYRLDDPSIPPTGVRTLGAACVIEVGNNVQAVFATQAEIPKGRINDALDGPGPADSPARESVSVEAPANPHPSPSLSLLRPQPAGGTGSTTAVLAPVAGLAVPIEQVPDPTFAQGIVGHGAARSPADCWAAWVQTSGSRSRPLTGGTAFGRGCEPPPHVVFAADRLVAAIE